MHMRRLSSSIGKICVLLVWKRTSPTLQKRLQGGGRKKKKLPNSGQYWKEGKVKVETEKRQVLTAMQGGKMKGLSRPSQMAKIRSSRKHHKWKNGGASQRAVIEPGNHDRDSKPEAPSMVKVNLLGALIHSDSKSDEEEKPQNSL